MKCVWCDKDITENDAILVGVQINGAGSKDQDGVLHGVCSTACAADLLRYEAAKLIVEEPCPACSVDKWNNGCRVRPDGLLEYCNKCAGTGVKR